MKTYFILCLFYVPFFMLAQTQTVSGTITDKVSKAPIVGATVVVSSVEEQTLGTSTDENGYFEIQNVPLGRQRLQCSYIGYETVETEGFIVSSTKAVALEIEMNEGSVSMQDVVVTASRNVNAPINELSVVSTRSFSADETDRIAASVNDPGRMALTYPGVAQGGDDNENDIIIRGNSAFGMLWRLEGIDIPNPNHFARPGTSGGGITVFSAQLLSRSDFSTGGMAAEYGNAISGAFDVHFRKGNQNERQHRFKFGILGIDLATEGPIAAGQSSYLANYRYSTLGLLTANGIYLVGERVENTFQDLSFNIALNGNLKNRFTIFGLGGLSREHYNPVENPLERDRSNSSHFEDRIRDGNVGVLGGTYTHLINKNAYFKAGIAMLGSEIEFYYDALDSLNNRSNYHDERHNENRISTSFVYSRKLDDQLRFKTGAFIHLITNYDFYKRTIQRASVSDVMQQNADLSINGQGNTQTLQYYAQISKDFNEQLTINAGGHFMFLTLNNTASIEPRLSLKYTPKPRHSFGFAYGLHSKILPMASYFYAVQDTVDGIIQTRLPNMDLPFVKSHHLIASYTYATPKGLRFSSEIYYQRLFNVPISIQNDNFYWMLNNSSEFPETVVASEGKGENYGIDLALEQFFSNQVYFLLTGSFFKSYFYPKNGERYPSTYANDFVSSLTFGREFNIKKERTLQIGARILYNGGSRYTPLDVDASLAEKRYVLDTNLFNSEHIPNYFRIDTRIAYRYNATKLSGKISLDIQNILNYKNPSNVAYDASTNSLFFRNHTSGLVPVLAFEFDF